MTSVLNLHTSTFISSDNSRKGRINDTEHVAVRCWKIFCEQTKYRRWVGQLWRRPSLINMAKNAELFWGNDVGFFPQNKMSLDVLGTQNVNFEKIIRVQDVWLSSGQHFIFGSIGQLWLGLSLQNSVEKIIFQHILVEIFPLNKILIDDPIPKMWTFQDNSS